MKKRGGSESRQAERDGEWEREGGRETVKQMRRAAEEIERKED